MTTDLQKDPRCGGKDGRRFPRHGESTGWEDLRGQDPQELYDRWCKKGRRPGRPLRPLCLSLCGLCRDGKSGPGKAQMVELEG